ncbi:MAG TPA: glycosyltransferase family 9 protein [Leptolyngbyaceae cyanobacterium M33_DOE_097]|uniref:Glycosyltransferase family 9 protein n=1 Tax=Oscillatoriales cyanobacterium SpSt-418 TaxID=2282169 RepID=A0A7C3PJR4_9CYAN|nr:glycosyltransferase family 9 protein [Leptolyngbyaceae cyanobacterium M33_DOE_097]
MAQLNSVLFIELLGGIGDIVIALPAIHALARSHPEATLTVLTFVPGCDLLEHDPAIAQVIAVPKGQARQAVEQLLDSQSFDLIVSDTNYDGIDQLVQKSGAIQTVTNLWRSPPANERVGDRFLQILLSEGVITSEAIEAIASLSSIYLTPEERLAARQKLGAFYRPLILLYPDAGMPIKRWSTQNFITLGQALQEQFGGTILVPVGSDEEQADQIATAIGKTAQVWPRSSLRELAVVIAAADLMVAVDTGIARIAAALDVPTITLFGPSWHQRYGQPTPHVNLQGFPGCAERLATNFTQQACWYSGECPFEWNTCLEDISPAQVLTAASSLLATSPDKPYKQEPINNQKADNQFSSHPAKLLPEWQAVRNLLVMRLDNIGDVIMTSPALKALQANLPGAKITLLASPAGALTAPLLPGIDQALPWRVLWQDLGKLDFNPHREWELVELLKKHEFDAAIIFTSFTQSPHPAALFCSLAGIPLRLGESTECDRGTLTHYAPQTPFEIHQVERNLHLIESVGFQVSDRRLSLQIPNSKTSPQSENFHPNQAELPYLHQPYILLNPWTSCQSRNYAPDRFAIAALHLSKITDWLILITGVEKDRDRAQPLLDVLGDRAIDLIGKTTLTELALYIANAQLVLTNNTSTMHIADAVSTPMLVLFAGTELECQWQPRHTSFRLLRRSTTCSPCYAFTCPYSLQCLDISPETVVSNALDLLNLNPD